MFVIGVWTLVDKSFINELLGTNLFMGAVYILIATGALVSLVSFFGCLGAIKEIKCMLLTVTRISTLFLFSLNSMLIEYMIANASRTRNHCLL